MPSSENQIPALTPETTQEAAARALAALQLVRKYVNNPEEFVDPNDPGVQQESAKMIRDAVQEAKDSLQLLIDNDEAVVAIGQNLTELLQIQENLTKLGSIEEELPKLVAIADDLQELLEVPEKAKEEFEKAQDLANAFGISGLGDRVAEWARTEAFDVVGSDTITQSGVTLPQSILWPNGVSGSLSNLTVTNGNITSLRYNYDGTAQYVTANIDYSDEFPVRTFTQTGFAI